MAVTINGTNGIETNADTGKVKVGADDDLLLQHDGNNSTIDNNTGDLLIRQLGSSGDIYLDPKSGERGVKVIRDGAVELYHDGTKKLESRSGGIGVFGHIEAGDDNKVMLGDSNDLRMYHSSGNSYIDNYTGHLIINSTASTNVDIMKAGHSVYLARFIPGGAVKLYWDSNLKFETEPGGGKITGSLTETSDRALKKDIQPLSNSLTNLKQLNGYSFAWKDNDIKSLGLIAQEVETIYPDLVTGEEGDKGLKYSGLIAPLLEAIKELSAEVDTLKTEKTKLQTDLTALTTRVAALEAA